MNIISRIVAHSWNYVDRLLEALTPVGDLVIRCWLSWIFLSSGITKVKSWSSTLYLFQYEYKVPYISSTIAAYLGTAAELILPILLILGLFKRLPAVGLFIFNIITVYSYPFLWTDTGTVGFNQHIYWGIMLLWLSLHGPGKITLSGLFKKA